VLALIAAGADVNAIDNAYKEYPVRAAIKATNTLIIQALLHAGACVDTPNADGITDRQEAVKRGIDLDLLRLQ